jgi:hypothetical protein
MDKFLNYKGRTGVLVASAWIEDSLEALLRANLAPDPKGADRLLRTDGPLGSFAAKVSLAYSLGLIGPDMRDDLDTIRSIRNEFAHFRSGVSFRDQSVRSRCKKLYTVQTLNAGGPVTLRGAHTQFMSSCLFLIRYLLTPQKKLLRVPHLDADAPYFLWIAHIGSELRRPL